MSDSDTVASCQGLTWGYDAWANRTAQTVTKGTCGQWSSSYTANNQISGYSYDATGNLLNDGVHSYTYDAEGRIVAPGGPGDAAGVPFKETTIERFAVREPMQPAGAALLRLAWAHRGMLLSW